EHYSDNGLNGSIPTTLGKLNNLVNLDLEDNLLSGTILPASLGVNTLKNMSGCMWVQPDRISILIFGKSNQPCELRTSEEFAEDLLKCRYVRPSDSRVGRSLDESVQKVSWEQPDGDHNLIFGQSNQPCVLGTSEEFAEWTHIHSSLGHFKTLRSRYVILS
ncbi:hypothetical protein EJB05_57866, partial [Eragrostis curvula]